MKTSTVVIATLCCFTLSETPLADALDHAKVLIAFESMYGVDGPFVGSHEVRDLTGDDTPWSIRHADGVVYTDGRVVVNVRGLVFSEGPKAGTNDAPEFRAVISCLTELDEDTIGTKNVFTAGFPASKSGNSFIHAHVDLPNPCVAPIVFIAPGDEDDWFAVTGVETD